ncbi:unnamed protein product [Candida verbasci]|uniref:CWH43-like N-terminal domain-containing protein n=1 Tax=Candida verbasci TaxID=1227364 RepID=A0A9W4TXH4_9ASCO|nr:unnamed protein product [Candida verbasci]
MAKSSSFEKKPIIRFQLIHYYLIPLIALTVWWGMLIAMLICWGVQGHPIYSFMDVHQNPVYLSDIGATNLQPLFISCAGFQAIFFVGTLVFGMYLRMKSKIQCYITIHQRNLAIASIVFAIIGQLGILFVSIFNTKNFPDVHMSMVGIFIAFCFFACVCDFAITCIFGTRPSQLNPIHHGTIFGKSKFANLYFVSFICKLIWLLASICFAAAFGYYMNNGNDSRSAKFEWTICFWYGFLLALWSMDLVPSAIRKYRSRHPERYGNELPVDLEMEKDLQNNSTDVDYDNPTFIGSPQPIYNNNQQAFNNENFTAQQVNEPAVAYNGNYTAHPYANNTNHVNYSTPQPYSNVQQSPQSGYNRAPIGAQEQYQVV